MIEIKEGRKYKLTSDLNKLRNIYTGYDSFMKHFLGKVITVREIRENYSDGLATFRINEDSNCYTWSNDVIEEDVNEEYCRILKEDDRSVKEFKIGDVVKFRSVENLKEYYNTGYILTGGRYTCKTLEYIDTKPFSVVIEDYKERKIENKIGKIIKVQDYSDRGIKYKIYRVKFLNIDKSEAYDFRRYSVNEWYSGENFEIVEEAQEITMEEEFEENNEIVQEMISKVDKNKFKKILASSFRKKGTDLAGIDKLLIQWATAKKDIYLLLGRNLTIRKDIEYAKEKQELAAEINELSENFPRN